MVRKIKESWWVDFQVRGQRYRLRSPDNHRDGAQAYETTLRRRLVDGKSVYLSSDPRVASERPESFDDFAARWFDTYVKTNLAESTQAEYAGVLRRVLVPFFGTKPLIAIDAYAIERLKASRRENASAKTVNNDLFVLSKLLRTAVEWGALQSAPRIQFLEQDPAKTDFLTPSESQLLLENTSDPKWRLFFFVALRTGLRAGELIGLRWEDIDLKTRLIIVRRNIVKGVVKSPKSRRIRYVAMASDLQSVLGAIRQPIGYVFVQFGDEPIFRHMAYNALKRACRRAGLRRVGLHALRHSFASHLVMEGKDLYSVGRLLGHADPITTQRYAHLAPAYLQSVVEALPRIQAETADLLVDSRVNLASTDGEQTANV